MEELNITEWFKVQEYDDGIGIEYNVKGGSPILHVHSRDHAEKIHTWLTQWLKENPVKVEGVLNIYPNEIATIYGNKGDAAFGATKDRIACIPISYHIGQGLETPEEET